MDLLLRKWFTFTNKYQKQIVPKSQFTSHAGFELATVQYPEIVGTRSTSVRDAATASTDGHRRMDRHLACIVLLGNYPM